MGMGYQGYVQFYQTGGTPPTDPLLLLATGASVNLVLEPIYSSAVLGYGWYNAPTSAHYADSAIRYEGGVDFEFQASANVWNFIRDWAIEQRAYPRSLDISPDGQRVYQYHTSGAYNSTFDNYGAWATSMSMNTSEGSFVTSSINVVSIFRTEGAAGDPYIQNRTGVIASNTAIYGATNPLNPGQANVDPIPFWKTNANLLRTSTGDWGPDGVGGTPIQTGLETIEWSIDLSNNYVVLYTCNGNRYPTAVLMGAIDASGNVTLYNNDGVFDPVEEALVAEDTCFRVQIYTDAGNTNSVYVDLPAVVVESDDFGIKGQSDVTTRGFSLKGLGGRIANSVLYPPMVMSLAT